MYKTLNILFFILFLSIIKNSFSASLDGEGREIGSPSFSRFISRASDEYQSLCGLVKVRCWKSTPIHSGQLLPVKMKYTIFLNSEVDKEIGNIQVNYYGKGGCYKTEDHQFLSEPIVQLKFITILEPERNKGYAKRALDALFQGLRRSPLLSPETVIGLEFDIDKPFLGHFYAKYGFQESSHLYFSGYTNPEIFRVMTTQLGKIENF